MLQVLMAFFFPLQGFFNCLTYLRPRYLRSKSRNPNATVRRIIYLALHHESHPIHGLQSMNGGVVQGETEEERMRYRYRRSTTASFYSVGNSKHRQSLTGEIDNDDASFSMNTVNAIASVSDYNRGRDEIALDAKNDEEGASNANSNDREALDSVAEELLPA
jgi:hypothetical protein